MIAIITVPNAITAKQRAALKKDAQDALGPDVKVVVVSGGITCQLVKAD